MSDDGSREDRWRSTLKGEDFQSVKRSSDSQSLRAVNPDADATPVETPHPAHPPVESRKMPARGSISERKREELTASLFEIAEGVGDLATETRAVLSDLLTTRRVFKIGIAILILTSVANFASTRVNKEERLRFEKRTEKDRAEAIAANHEAIKSNREILNAVKATLKAATAANATAAKAAAVAACGPAADRQADEVAASVAQTEVAALEVEAAIAPPSEKPAVRKRLKAAEEKVSALSGF